MKSIIDQRFQIYIFVSTLNQLAYLNLKIMIKLKLALVALMFLFTASVYSQSVSNVLNLTSFSVEKNGKTMENDLNDGSMLVAFNKTPLKVYEDGEMTYWVEYKYKQCGRKVKLQGTIIVELKNGDKIKGKKITAQEKIGDNDPGYFIGHYNDEITYDGKDRKVVIDFDYTFRYKGYALASKYKD